MRWSEMCQQWRSLCLAAACPVCGLIQAALPAPPGSSLPPSYRVDTWKTEQGLPQNSVKEILQTRDGYLWMGTQFGMVRFDGVSFRIFDRPSTPGMAADNCMGMVEAVDGSLWVASDKHLLHYKDRRWVSIPLGEHRPVGRRWGLSRSRDGGVWLATDHGLFRFHEDKVARYTVADGLESNIVYGVCEDEKSGAVYVATPRMIQRRDPMTGQFRVYAVVPEEFCLEGWQFYLDHAGNLWTTHMDGVRCWREGSPPLLFTVQDGLYTPILISISEDRQGAVWLITLGGNLCSVTNGRLERRPDLVPEQDQALCLYEDQEANLWIGTTYGGVRRLQRRHMSTFLSQDGLLNDDVYSICQSKDGSLWFGGGMGLTRLKEHRVQIYPLPPEDPGNRVYSIFEDRSSQMWVGTRTRGLLRMVDGKLVPFPLMANFGMDQPNAFCEDRAGRLWIGTTGGLYRMENGSIKRFTTQDGLSYNNIRGVLEDRRGDLWLATYGGGINRLREGVFTAYTKKEGLSDNVTWLLYEDADGVLWIGTEHGLNRFKDGRITPLTTECGLFDDVINGLLESDDGNFWIGCNRGIYRVSKRDLNQVADGAQTRVNCAVYGNSDGMDNSETNGETQPSACRAKDGLFWFPTVKGAVFFDPRHLRSNSLPPPVVIEEVLVDRKPVSPLSPSRLPPGRGKVVEFRYTGNSLVAPEKVLYRYRLEGYDNEWTDAGNRREAFYTNLRPGPYRFQVVACNNHGVWNQAGASVALVFAPYFHQTWAFYVLCGLASVTTAFGLHRRRVRVLARIQRLEQQHALDLERSRIAQDMHDEMGSSLTRIRLLSELARRDLHEPSAAEPHLAKIQHTSGELFRSMDEIVWTVNPRHDTLDSLVGYICRYSQNYLGLAGIRCRLDVPAAPLNQPLTSEQRHNLLLAVKEALHNAVRHAQAAEVWMRVAVTSSQLVIAIEDDGRGFNSSDADANRNGLANMRRRLEELRGRMEIVSSPGHGTKILLYLPLTPPSTQ